MNRHAACVSDVLHAAQAGTREDEMMARRRQRAMRVDEAVSALLSELCRISRIYCEID